MFTKLSFCLQFSSHVYEDQHPIISSILSSYSPFSPGKAHVNCYKLSKKLNASVVFP